MATVLFPRALRPDDLPLGDNGRLFCGRLRCAGSTAYATGTTLAGHPVHRLTVTDAHHWYEELGRCPQCEGCGREFQMLTEEAR